MWDHEAITFDEAVDHGLTDPTARRAWEELLHPLVGAAPARIADLGCGTGTLAVLLATQGHDVSGVDFSEQMVSRAREKAAAAGVDPEFLRADAATPPLRRGAFDVVLSRHVLWAMPDPSEAVRHWLALLRPQGRLILVEGRWHTGAGLTMAECTALLSDAGAAQITSRMLPDPALWGSEITDERFVVTASQAQAGAWASRNS